jgi:hypothetical protein
VRWRLSPTAPPQATALTNAEKCGLSGLRRSEMILLCDLPCVGLPRFGKPGPIISLPKLSNGVLGFYLIHRPGPKDRDRLLWPSEIEEFGLSANLCGYFMLN